jgi:hypothetical protein
MAGAAVAALARREAELDKREMAMRTSARIANMKQEATQIAAKAKAAVQNIKEDSKLAVASNGAARVGGMVLESYLRNKVWKDQPDRMKSVGPLATVAAIVGYTLGMQESKPANQFAYFTAAGVAEGVATTFLKEQIDRAMQ